MKGDNLFLCKRQETQRIFINEGLKGKDLKTNIDLFTWTKNILNHNTANHGEMIEVLDYLLIGKTCSNSNNAYQMVDGVV